MSKLLKFLLFTLLASQTYIASAETISAKGSAEVSVKANKGDLIAARRVARNAAEADAIVAAIKLKLNVNPNDPKSKAAISDLVKQLTDNLKTTYVTEGDVLTAKSSLEVDSGQIFDLARSLDLGSKIQTASARVLFIIDEYVGIATSLDPSQPLETSMEYSHDKSSFSDKSAKSSAADASASSNKSANAYAAKESSAVSARESAAVNAKDSASAKSKSAVAVNAKESSSAKAKSSAAASANDQNGSASGAASSQGSASRSGSYSGAASAEDSASRSSSYSAAKASKYDAASASNKSGSASAQGASSSSSSSSSDQKDIAEQKDIVNMKVTTKFPDVNNAKPSEGGDELIAARLESVSQQFGLELTSERDFRVEGGRKLLIKDIEKLSKFSYYTQKAAKAPYNAKYFAYGTAVMNSEGKTSSGDVACAGQLKVQSSNVDTGANLFSDTIVKGATGSSDQACRANLSSALATALAEAVGTRAQREIQRTGTQGQSYEIALYSVLKVPFKVKKNFAEQLQKMSDEFVEGNATDTSRNFTVQAKGNFKTKVEDLMEEMKDQFPDMKEARLESKGNRLVVCIEGKCPTE